MTTNKGTDWLNFHCSGRGKTSCLSVQERQRKREKKGGKVCLYYGSYPSYNSFLQLAIDMGHRQAKKEAVRMATHALNSRGGQMQQ